jgi:hypothetical protein
MRRVYAGLIAAIAWWAVIGQFFQSEVGTIDYFSYFTILSNILVALTLTAAALAPQSSLGRLLLRPTVATATALYITVTGLVYWVILSKLYQLQGWTLIYDRLLHYVVPPGYVVYWLCFVPKGTLHLRHVPAWLIFPLLYGAWTLVHGAIGGWYPYPFVNVTTHGHPRVFLNILEFVVFFSLVGSIYVLVDRLLGRFTLGGPMVAVRSS